MAWRRGIVFDRIHDGDAHMIRGGHVRLFVLYPLSHRTMIAVTHRLLYRPMHRGDFVGLSPWATNNAAHFSHMMVEAVQVYILCAARTPAFPSQG